MLMHLWINQQETHKEHVSVEDVAKRKDLIITNADKGSGVILNDREKEANE